MREPASAPAPLEPTRESHESAVETARSAGDPPALAAALEHFGAFLANHGEPAAAIRRYQQALAIYQRLSGVEAALRCHRWLGQLHRLSSHTDRAAAHYRQAYLLALELGDATLQAHAANGWAVLHEEAGDLGSAVPAFEEAMALFESSSSAAEAALVATNLARSLTQLGLDQQAQALLTKAAATDLQQEDAGGLLAVRIEQGWLHMLSGELEAAEEALVAAKQLWSKGTSALDRAGTLGRLGTLRMLQDRRSDAAELHAEALQIAETEGLPLSAAYSRINLCQWAATAAQAAAGLRVCNAAVAAAEATGNPAVEASALFWRSRWSRAFDSAAAAVGDALAAVELLERADANVSGRRNRVRFVSDRADIYRQVVAMQTELGHHEQALLVSDRLRSRDLAETLARIPTPISASEAGEFRRLLLRLAKLERQWRHLGSGGDEAEAEQLGRALREVYSQYQRFEDRGASGQQRLTVLAASAGDLETLQRCLGADQVLLVYSLGETRSFLWQVEKDRLRSHVLSLGEDGLDELVQEFVDLLADPAGWAMADQLEFLGTRLRDVLLAPIADLSPSARLLVVPDGVLRYLPFAALSVGRKGKFLIADHEVVQAPSLALLTSLCQRSGSPATRTIAVLADPVYGLSDSRWGGSRAAWAGAESFPRLRASADEAEAIREIFGGAEGLWATGFQASAAAIRGGDLDLSDFQILHFAVHGRLDPEHPELSSLVLSRYGRDGSSVDGHLRVGDIFLLDLNAQLVVASACETGLGGDLKSEALSAFAQAFVAAGAEQVLVSLWLLNDRASALLMGSFYRHLWAGGNRPGAALRLAQLELMADERYRSPHFWAPYVLQGTGAPLRTATGRIFSDS